MDACARIRGVPLKTRASVRKEIISENVVQSVKSLLKSSKELCRVVFEDYQKEPICLTEVHFVGLPSLAEGVDIQTQPHAAVSIDLLELLKSLHVHSLKDEEVVLLKDTKKHFETKDSTSQTPWSKAVCVIRYSPALQRSIGNTVFALLSKYTTGMRYALELHSLQKNLLDTCHTEEDDTNQSVSSIEDDFVTALEHLDEEETAASESTALSYYNQRNQCDVASQTVPSRCADTSGSKIVISSVCRKSSYKPASLIPEVSLSMKSSVTISVSDPGRQSSFYRPCSPQEEHMDSEESECSSPSPIIFLDEDGYQRSLKAKLDIPELPVLKDGVEDSDSEVSEFFDSFDQFDELDQTLEDATSASQTQKRKYTQDQSTKFVSIGCSTTAAMNPHKFDHPILPANVRKPTPLKPESPYSVLSEVPDSPRPVRTSGEESGALFSPICSSAFSPLGSCSASEYFWKTDEEKTELGKPQDLAALYKTYSDYASNISNEILGSVCGYTSPVDMKLNKNLSCVCHMKFKNRHGHLLKLTDFQQMVTVAKPQHKSQQLKDGIQRLATDLVERSLGSAFRDLQKGVSSCTTTLCHLAARLTSSVFQMAFHEIGMRHAYVLKERAVNGLASFLVGEAVSGALKEFQFVKKQMFNNTVTRFAADLAEELVFEGIMEVCQFSQPPTPSTPSSWSFEQEEKVVQSYATDLSESVLQEAFIELSQADVTFTTQAAISVSLDNIRYVRAESITQATKTCNVSKNDFGLQNTVDPLPLAKDICTVEKALLCASGVASCISVPVAGKVISPNQTCQNSTRLYCTSEMSPKRTIDSGQKSNVVSSEEVSATRSVQLLQVPGQFDPSCSHASNGTNSETEQGVGDESEDYATSELTPGTANFQNFSGTMVDLIVNEAYELMSSSKVKKTVEECADYMSKKIVDRMPSVGQLTPRNLYAEHLAESIMKHTVDKVKTKASYTNESGQIQTSTTMDPVIVVEYTKQNPATYDEDSNQLKGNIPEEIPTFAMLPSLNVIDDAGPSITGLTSTLTKALIEQRESDDAHHIHHALFRDSLEVPGHEVEFSSASRDQNREVLCVEQGNSSGSPGTPPPTPQQPQNVCQEKRIKQFSKKLKGKLANEFSPATPPSTPRNQSDTSLTEVGSETEKADFMLKLMRSLSDEAEGSEEEDEEEQEAQSVIQMGTSQTEQRTSVEMGISNTERGTVRYADRLACHILSMATEMATLCLEDGRRPERTESKPLPFCTALVGQFSEQSLNSLRNYAGEVAGEVISDVKKMISLNQYRHKAFKRGLDCFSECQHLGDHEQDCRNERLNNMAEQWSGDLLASVLNFPPCNGLSGLSSKYPSCESVTDEYAGHIIRVLKREGGNSELILDQYASRLAYRSIKLGLAQAARKIKHKCNMRLYSTRRSPHDSTNELFRFVNAEQNHEMDYRRKVKGSSAGDGHQCVPQLNEEMNSSEYMELLGFAESLAYNITCDVTRKLRSSTVRLPKSLTDSCLYKKSKLEDMSENLIKTTFSCSLLPCTQRNKQYHSTGSLNDCNCSDNVMQVIEHYARKIVDDTLEMTLASGNPQSVGDRGKMDRQTYAETLSEATLKSALADKACRFSSIKDHPYYVGAHCSYAARQQLQEIPRRRKQECESKTDNCCNRIRGCGRGIPRIHIDLEQKVVFAEEMVSWAIEKAKKDLSSTSLTADSGIGHDGASFAESFTTEIMTSVMSNVCQTINISAPGKEGLHTSESTVSQQLSLSVGDDSTGSWSNLSFEDEHPDESSSFLHLSDSDGTEDKEVEPKDDTEGLLHVGRALLVVNSDMKAHSVDLQLRITLQWIAASHAELPVLQFCQPPEKELGLLPLVLKRAKEREWKVGDLLQAVLRHCEELEQEEARENRSHKPFFEWLLECA